MITLDTSTYRSVAFYLPIGRQVFIMSISKSKQEILSVATRLFARKGYEATSLQSIADQVGMKKPSLLYHYPSKGALKEAVLDDLMYGWRVRLPEILATALTGEDRFSALFDEVTCYFKADPHRALLIMREVVDRPVEAKRRLGDGLKPWIAMLSTAITDGKEAGRVRESIDPQAYLIECIVLIVGTFAATELAASVFDNGDRGNWLDRQLKETLRMAKTSLFNESYIQRG